MRPASRRPRYRPPVPHRAGDYEALAPAAHELTTATQQEAVEFETLADAVNRPIGRSIARNTAIVALAFIASRILGFLREILIANQFGTGGEASAYAAAFRVPDLLFLVVMSAGFGSAFIPVFGGFLARNDDRGAWNLANAVLTWAVGLTVVAGVLIFVLADPIIRYLIAPNLADEYIQLSANLMRILVISPLLLGLGIAAKGILEAQDQFLMPALAPLIYNLGIIVGIVVLAPTAGIEGVATGVIIGAAGHALIQLPAVLRSGLRFQVSLSRSVDGLSEVARLLVPRVVGQVAFAANFIVITNFASSLGEGGPASINYAWQLLMLPHGILALSISTVIFPAMARQWERADVAGLNRTLSEAIRPLIFLSIPITIALFLFREPIVAALLQRGDFNRASTVAVAAPLAALAAALIAYGLVEVLTRAFYAMKDARTPVIAGLIIIVINIAVAALTIDPYDGLALGLALGISTSVEAVILITVLIARFRALGVHADGSWLPWLGRVALATVVSFAFGLATANGLDRLWAESGSSYLVRAALLVIAVVLVLAPYALVAWATAIPELAAIESRLAGLTAPLRRVIPANVIDDLGASHGLRFDRSRTAQEDYAANGAHDLDDDADDPVPEPEPEAERRRGEWEGRAGGSRLSEGYRDDRDWLYREDDRPASRTDERRRRARPIPPMPVSGSGDDHDQWRPMRPTERPERSRSPFEEDDDDRLRTGRFGNGRRPSNDTRNGFTRQPGRSAPPVRPPFRSVQQPTMPAWYTPTRRGRREPQSNDYTEGSSGRSNRPRPDR